VPTFAAVALRPASSKGRRWPVRIVHKRSAADDLIALLSKPQLEEIRWVNDPGEEPPGG